ncbi:galactose oxidase [Shewanella olleyana]|uniref:Kelch repeat-containing protein n=1 Tax=Shewanella olleyana TaxID=135626 RepID=UPI00200CC0FA|nr:kelch repeat-containing protein [Shewanella olleyana]MCL1068419.1 galactose oxidase [Shewanella olleyana]
MSRFSQLQLGAVAFVSATSMFIAPANASYPALPEGVSNNAVAKVSTVKGDYLLSFTGLADGKDYQAVHNKVWGVNLSNPDSQWQPMKALPFVAPLAGRLASIAIGLKDKAYVFGGYTVAKNHEEISTVDNYRFDVITNQYQRIADMPVAVDDTSASIYQQRYIYLFGGWHNDGNVNLVQVYDTQTDTWDQASPIPAPAVFGQAVAMTDNKIVLCDGVKVQANIGKRRNYQSSPVCLYGEVNPDNHLRISWQLLPHYSVTDTQTVANTQTVAKTQKSQPVSDVTPVAHYRMAATGIKHENGGQAVFIGGSNNPYNYSGIGYNGEPSEPNNQQYTFDFTSMQWLKPIQLTTPSMDHRGLICHQGSLLRVGGMLSHQKLNSQILSTPLRAEQSCTQ